MSTEKKRRNCPLCGGEIFAQAVKCKHCKSTIEPEPEEPQGNVVKDCPFCNEKISVKAIKCEHCESLLEDKTDSFVDRTCQTEASKPNGNPDKKKNDGDAIERKGNTSGNINSFGIACFFDNWIYFANDLDEDKIYKMHNDGGDIHKVTDNGAQDINVIDGKIYYIGSKEGDGIYSANLDGSEQKMVIQINAATRLLVVKDVLYFLKYDDNYSLYRADSDGRNVQCICEDDIYCYDVHGDWVYYYNMNSQLCKLSSDGKERKTILETVAEDLTILAEWIYFLDEGRLIKKVRLDGTEVTKLNDIPEKEEAIPYVVNVTPDWVYFSSLFDHNKLYKIRFDGSEISKLCDLPVSGICDAGDWLFCGNYLGHEKIKVNKKETSATRIDGSPIDDLLKVHEARQEEERKEGEAKKAEEMAEELKEKDYLKKTFTFTGRGNTTGNIINEGLACLSEGWIYYINNSDDGSIYKVRPDGSENMKINDDDSLFINVIGTWIFYSNKNDCNKIYRIQIDGEKRNRVSSRGADLVLVDDKWIYFKGRIESNYEETYGKLFKLCLQSGEEQLVCNDKIKIYDVHNNWLYYCNDDDKKLYKIQNDGNNRTLMYDGYVIHFFLGVINEWIYFFILDKGVVLCKMQLDGSEFSQVARLKTSSLLMASPTSINVLDGCIFFTDSIEESLYKLNIDDGELHMLTEISDGEIKNINLAGEWIYYCIVKKEDYFCDKPEIFKIRTDGTENSRINSTLLEEQMDYSSDLDSLQASNIVKVGGLSITIPGGYIYTTDSNQVSSLMGERIITAIITEDEFVTDIDENFRAVSKESFFITKVAEVKFKTSFTEASDSIFQLLYKFPGQTELIKKSETVMLFFNDLGANSEEQDCIIYFGFIVTNRGFIYSLQVQYNYNGGLEELKQRTISILEGIDDEDAKDPYQKSISEHMKKNYQEDEYDSAITAEATKLNKGSLAKETEKSNDKTNGVLDFEGYENQTANNNIDNIKVNFEGKYPLATPPDNICDHHLHSYSNKISAKELKNLMSNTIKINKGVDLSMEAIKVGLYTPAYDNKRYAWEYARVFRVDDDLYKNFNDREVEIQSGMIRNVANLSALRSFAWTLQGYMIGNNRELGSASIDEIKDIGGFIESKGFLNYTIDSYFPALCNVTDFGSAYIAASQSDSHFNDACKLTGCKSCGNLFMLREELSALIPVMEKIRDYLSDTRKDTKEQLSGVLSDVLYSWCAINLAADGAFRIVDGPLNYNLELNKGDVNTHSLPYWFGDEVEGPPVLEVIDSISRFSNADFNGTYFECELVGTGYEGRATRFEWMHKDEQVVLKRNPDNPYDSNAIEVFNVKGESLGHVPKDKAGILSPAIDDRLVTIVSAKVLSIQPLSKMNARAKNPYMRIAVYLSYYG